MVRKRLIAQCLVVFVFRVKLARQQAVRSQRRHDDVNAINFLDSVSRCVSAMALVQQTSDI
jgi:hypothetical protein